jgi:hypothetical protein
MSMIGNYLRLSHEQLEHLRRAPSEILDVLYPPGDVDPPDRTHLDIDKSWQAIQFLLTGHPWDGEPPLQNAVMGGSPISDEDVGYGPARALTPEEVRAVSTALATTSGEQLWSRFDESAFAKAEIYPHGWSADGKDYVVGYYESLRTFFSDAARAGDAMILYLN